MSSLTLRMQRSAPSEWPTWRLVGWSTGGSLTAPVRESLLHLVRHEEREDPIDAQALTACGRRLPRLSKWDFPSNQAARATCASCRRIVGA